jgi:hypothetical protein
MAIDLLTGLRRLAIKAAFYGDRAIRALSCRFCLPASHSVRNDAFFFAAQLRPLLTG